MTKKRRFLIVIGATGVAATAGLFVCATILTRQIEPYIRDQAMDYLRAGFDSEVELASLSINMPSFSSLKLLLTSGGGARAKVSGEGLIMRHKGRRDLPPLFAVRRFSFDVDLGTIFQSPIVVPSLLLEDMEIHIPPKGERPDLNVSARQHLWEVARSAVFIHVVEIRKGKLVILPGDPRKKPLEFDLHRVRFESAGLGVAMKYDAELTNSRPPGEVRSRGTLGPWRSDDPGSTPLRGEYSLENADLSVFPPIGGILRSTGNFEGTLDHVSAKGQARVPDFHLKDSGNRLPLQAQFEVVVDGTNGNTILNDVFAKLGHTELWVHGGVIKNEGDVRRTISTTVSIPRGDMRDIFRLAMRGPPLMEGQIALKTRVQIPPLDQKVREKLVVGGRFWISGGKFLRPDVQEKIDILSRRGQGHPKNEEIAGVLSHMTGEFHLEEQVIAFRKLTFGVPGAEVNLAGNYDLAQDILDLHGNLKLTAKVSQTMTGAKRWLLKPVDPFMSKKGAGTYIAIKVQGSSKEPKFGRD